MRRALYLVVLALALPVAAPCRMPADPLRIPHQAGESTVYVTKADKLYHREGCDHLRHDKHAITLSEAKAAGYARCGVCKPLK